MAVIKHHKYVSALPATLEADSIYYVRRGTGFDIYVTNSTGLVVAYPLNQAPIRKTTGITEANYSLESMFDVAAIAVENVCSADGIFR